MTSSSCLVSPHTITGKRIGDVRTILTSAASSMLAVLAARAPFAALSTRYRELQASGELERRIRTRRECRIERALDAAGLVLAPVHAAVHVGSVPASDLDDVGLLERAMRRAAHDQPLAHAQDTADASIPSRTRALLLHLVALALALVGVACTLVPLVRPLDGDALWWALAGATLIATAWLLARQSTSS